MVKHSAAVIVLAACGSTTGTPTIDAKIDKITSIAVTPMTNTVKRGVDAQQLSAMAMLNDGTSRDVTGTAVWSSSDATLASVDTGRVEILGSGSATITASVGTVSGSATFSISNPLMYMSEAGTGPGLDVFDAFQSGDTAPMRKITGASTTLSFPWACYVTDTEIYVSDGSANAIDVFAIDATGNVAPTRQIKGASTTLSESFGLAVYNNEIYATSLNAVVVFPQTGNGNIAPTRTITGTATGLTGTLTGLTIADGELYVVSEDTPSVSVFPVTASGNVAPTRAIVGTHTNLAPFAYSAEVYNHELIVGVQNGVVVFAQNATGDVAPLRNIRGPDTVTGLTGATRLGHEIYGASYTTASVSVVPLEATNDTVPTRVLKGPTSTISSPRTVCFH